MNVRPALRLALLAAVLALASAACSDMGDLEARIDELSREVETQRTANAALEERLATLNEQLTAATDRVAAIENAVVVQSAPAPSAGNHPAMNASIETTCDGHLRSTPCSLEQPIEHTGPFRSAPFLWGMPTFEACVEVLAAPTATTALILRLVRDDVAAPAPPTVLPFEVEAGNAACGRVEVTSFSRDSATRSILEVDAAADVQWRLTTRFMHGAIGPETGAEHSYLGEGIDRTTWFYASEAGWSFCWSFLEPPPDRNGEVVGTDGRRKATVFTIAEERLLVHEWTGLALGDSDCTYVPTSGITSLLLEAYGRSQPWRVVIDPTGASGQTVLSRDGETWDEIAERLGVEVDALAEANAEAFATDEVAPGTGTAVAVPSSAHRDLRTCGDALFSVSDGVPLCLHTGSD